MCVYMEIYNSLVGPAKQVFGIGGRTIRQLIWGFNHFDDVNSRPRRGDFLLMNTAANGLQVFDQNDNGWDQA